MAERSTAGAKRSVDSFLSTSSARESAGSAAKEHFMTDKKRCMCTIFKDGFRSVAKGGVLLLLLLGGIGTGLAQTARPNRIGSAPQAPTYTVLYTFTGGADGWHPNSGLVGDAAGNFYGTTWVGGAHGYGEVYELDPAGKLTVLYSFTGGTDGGYPRGVVFDRSGNFYGTTWRGGTADEGVVFKLDRFGKETVVYTFSGGLDGGTPTGIPVLDPEGNLYGTTDSGGGGAAGTIFKVDTAGNETVLYSFGGGPGGAYPEAGVIRDAAGNLYGTAAWGGTCWYYLGCGVIFKLDPDGNYTVLHSFTYYDGDTPEAGLLRDAEGNLYGTTWDGGAAADGVVFKLDPAGNYTLLYSGGGNGARFDGELTRDGAGNLYGTAYYGGLSDAGVVFKLDAAGNYRVLYKFKGGTDGANPAARLVLHKGSIYGVATGGDSYGYGVLFKLTR
jgi:uncharacterized repeat protein (TIGR03803 family)